ncbi:TolC family protein [bacterium]|nr:TolC family protein [bacterium]
MKKKNLFVIGVLLAAAAVSAETLSLEDCIGLAMTGNPDLKRSEYAVAQSTISARQAWSSLLPRVSANASTSNSGPFISETNEAWDWNMGGSVSQPFYSPGLYTRIGLAGTQKKSMEYNLDSQRDQVRASVQMLYYQILNSDTLLEVYRANIDLAGEQIEKMRRMVDLGMKRESDLLKSEVQKGSFEAQLVREQESMASSKRNLNILMGRRPDAELDLLPLSVDRIDVPDFEDACGRMLENSPMIRRMKAQVDAENLSLRIAKEAFLPSVSGSYSYSRSKNAFSAGDPLESDAVRLNLSLDLFDGFNKIQNVQSGRLGLKEAQVNFEATLRDAVDALLGQYKAMETQNRLIGIHQTNLASARKDLEVVSQQYASGLSTILDLTDAQVSVFESEAGLLQDLFARKRIEAEIRRLIGAM